MIKQVKEWFTNEELRKKIMLTLLLLLLYRAGIHVPLPGITLDALKSESLGSLALLGLFGGGQKGLFSVFALGVMPYIMSSLIIQLLSQDVVPILTRWKEEGEYGQRKVKRLTYILTAVFGFAEGYGVMISYDKGVPGLFTSHDTKFFIMLGAVIMIGTLLLVWIGETITKKGIGNGVSLIILASILTQLPQGLTQIAKSLFAGVEKEELFLPIAKSSVLLLLLFGLYVVMVMVHEAKRNIPVSSSKKGMGSTNLPIKLLVGGVTPVIFASSFLVLPSILGFIKDKPDWVTSIQNSVNLQHWIGIVLYGTLIILFSFFYAFIVLEPKKIAENLGKGGQYVPSVRPGKETEEYFKGVIFRITVFGGFILAAIAIFPPILNSIGKLPATTSIGGVGLLLLVNVSLDTLSNMKQQSASSSYTRRF